jgi:hypothetical protein
MTTCIRQIYFSTDPLKNPLGISITPWSVSRARFDGDCAHDDFRVLGNCNSQVSTILTQVEAVKENERTSWAADERSSTYTRLPVVTSIPVHHFTHCPSLFSPKTP